MTARTFIKSSNYNKNYLLQLFNVENLNKLTITINGSRGVSFDKAGQGI